MTEQQAKNPLDELFRKTFESLPDSPAASGWDTPSERVWHQVQSNIQTPQKGWGIQSLLLFAAIAATLAVGLFWMFGKPAEKPAPAPAVTPMEQPAITPASTVVPDSQPVESAPKSSSGGSLNKASQNKPVPGQSLEGAAHKASENSAQPLPGSKTTLPPNTLEAQKNKGERN